jgi:DNA-binding MltR family transcriptional regulator
MKSSDGKNFLEKEHIEDFDQLVAQFREESDRAAVILGTAKLDFLLYQLLGSFMVASYSNEDPLFENDGPLSTFSARINLSYRLGLVDEEFAKALHLVRKIRNDFAHDIKDSQLSNPPHKERIQALTLLFKHTEIFKDVKKAYFSDLSGPAANFFTALSVLIMRLETIIIKITPLSSNSAFGIRLS